MDSGSIVSIASRSFPALKTFTVGFDLSSASGLELAYDERGNFLSGTFADYLCPTAVEVPPVDIGHVETLTPVNALGAKGMGDGSSMLTPAAIANAVADALGRDDVTLPFTRGRVWAYANGRDPDAKRATAPATTEAPKPQGALTGEGEVLIFVIKKRGA